MAVPVLKFSRFSARPPLPEEPGRKDPKPLKIPVSPIPLAVAGALTGLTLFSIAAAVFRTGRPPLERHLIELVNRLFPIGPRREWLLRGFPRYEYLPYLPALTPDLAHLSRANDPLKQRGIDAIGAAWYRALQHRYNSSDNLIQMAKDPQFVGTLMPEVRRDQGDLRNLMTLCRQLQGKGVVFSETQKTDLDEMIAFLDSIS